MDQRCETCRFWQRVGAYNLYQYEENLLLEETNDDPPKKQCIVGGCRRSPPTIDGSVKVTLDTQRMREINHANSDIQTFSAAVATIFPHTYYNDWCGEHQPLPPTIENPVVVTSTL